MHRKDEYVPHAMQVKSAVQRAAVTTVLRLGGMALDLHSADANLACLKRFSSDLHLQESRDPRF